MSSSSLRSKVSFGFLFVACASAGAASCAADAKGSGGSTATAASGASVASSSSSSSGAGGSSSSSSSSSGAGGSTTSSSGGGAGGAATSSGGGAGGAATSSGGGAGGASTSSSSSSSSSGAGGMAPAPTVVGIDPTNSLASAPTVGVVIQGADFVAKAQVTVAGVSVPTASCDYAGVPSKIVCTIPGAAAPVRGDVVVTNPDLQKGSLLNGFTYTGVVNAVGFCNIQFPKDLTGMNQVKAGTDVMVYGQVYQAGLTDANNNPAPGISSDFGLSPMNPAMADSDPTASTAWRFSKAVPNPGYDFSQHNDEYQFDFAPAMAASYLYVYRFSLDGGLNFTYCDTDDANNGYDATKIGHATVVP